MRLPLDTDEKFRRSHITLSMAALAFLTITDNRSRHLPEPDEHDLSPAPAQAPEKGARRAALKS